jgi:3-hydroxyacyl-[acyl-carrier-protein] dehydratase
MTQPIEYRLPLPIAADHPAFAGHFPGAPIVPGVVLIDCALAAIQTAQAQNLLPGEFSVVKFLQPVHPGDALTLIYSVAQHSDERAQKINFRIECNGAAVASATLNTPPVSANQEINQ